MMRGLVCFDSKVYKDPSTIPAHSIFIFENIYHLFNTQAIGF